MNDNNTENRTDVAIVTDASSALGQELCRALLAHDVRVAGIAPATTSLDDLAAHLGPDFFPVTADVADQSEVSQAIGKAAATLGAPTILINNAGVCPYRDILDETPQTFMDTVAINLGGVFNCCHAVLPAMVAQGTGRILNISTFAHLAPAPTEAAYAITKGAARTLTKAMVADLGDRFPGIVINDWIPGELKTQTSNPDGIEPATSAQWGVRLALWRDPMLTGRLFDKDSEILEPLSLKRRVLNWVIGRKRAALRLS